MSSQAAVYWQGLVVKQERRDVSDGFFGEGLATMSRVGARLGGVVKRMHRQAMMTVRGVSPHCPDGESHHPSVCARGWRGDICFSCPFCKIA